MALHVVAVFLFVFLLRCGAFAGGRDLGGTLGGLPAGERRTVSAYCSTARLTSCSLRMARPHRFLYSRQPQPFPWQPVPRLSQTPSPFSSVKRHCAVWQARCSPVRPGPAAHTPVAPTVQASAVAAIIIAVRFIVILLWCVKSSFHLEYESARSIHSPPRKIFLILSYSPGNALSTGKRRPAGRLPAVVQSSSWE